MEIGIALLAAFCTVLGAAAIAIPLVLLRSWALVTLWGWFVVPFGVPQVHYLQGVALFLIVGLCAEHQKFKNHEIEPIESLALTLLSPLVAVGTGWIIRLLWRG